MSNTLPLRPTLWRTCRVLANRTRLDMLRLLFRKPGLTVSGVAQLLELSMPLTSLYLRALEARGLLSAHRKGRWVHYRLPSVETHGPAAALVAALRQEFQHGRCSTEAIFKLGTAFTHPRRIEIFRALQPQPLSFIQLQAATRLGGRALQRHLRKLHQRGFVRRQRKGFYAAVTLGGNEAALGRALAILATE